MSIQLPLKIDQCGCNQLICDHTRVGGGPQFSMTGVYKKGKPKQRPAHMKAVQEDWSSAATNRGPPETTRDMDQLLPHHSEEHSPTSTLVMDSRPVGL